MQNADKLTPEDIRRLFPDEEIAEAAGVLEMISQAPEQLMLYNARLKFQRDAEARLQKAREDGIREGEARGRLEGFLAGRIVLFQELLGNQCRRQIPRIGWFRRIVLHQLPVTLTRQFVSRLSFVNRTIS